MKKAFMDQDFMLSNDTAKTLYHDYAEQMPIIDYHCHINPAEIAKDRTFDTITQVWLGGDHYKWRTIRANGVPEDQITGADSSDREKFQMWANTLPKLIGNPLYHWTHLELQRYFDVHLPLNGENAEEIWTRCNQALRSGLSVRKMITRANVKVICTTDDPIDSLEYHQEIASDPTFPVAVYPAFRPDRAVNIGKSDFSDYLEKLAEKSKISTRSFDGVCHALSARLDFFQELGCRVSDHGLDAVVYRPASREEVEAIYQKRIGGAGLTTEEIEAYQTALLLFLGKEYAKRGIVMQLHYGAARNCNDRYYKTLGPDTGFDSIAPGHCADGLAPFLNALDSDRALPKTIVYSLNPNDNDMISTIIGCFQEPETAGKLQLGCPWWFNDHEYGMRKQLTDLANGGVLGNFIGMLTDSRSFLSYTRHEYFRRILCDVIGRWVEDGKYPDDLPALGAMVQDICYYNAMRYFGF